MTKSTITREQLRALAVKKIESLKFAITQSAFTNIRRGLEDELQLAKFALAAMDGEPVAKKVACWSCQNEVEISAIGDCDGCCPNCNSPIDLDEEPYAAPQPAPVVRDEMPCGGAAYDYHDGYQDGWNACRAAMLQAEPVTSANKLGKSPVIPDTWIPVSERLPEEGGRYWCYVEEQNSLGKSHYQWNCSWNGEIWGGAMMYGRVTHWMPLPAAPQEVKP